MTPSATKPRVTSFAPQFLVDNLERSIEYYKKLGFQFGEPWEGFCAIGHIDGTIGNIGLNRFAVAPKPSVSPLPAQFAFSTD